MPFFDFTISKKSKGKNKITKNNTYSIVSKNINGVVTININGNYFVKVDTTEYSIIPESYSCKNRILIFFKILSDINQRILWIRNIDNLQELNTDVYLPFAPGVCVKGDILKINSKLMFRINKVYIDYNNDEANVALKFWKDNYKLINNNIMNVKIE